MVSKTTLAQRAAETPKSFSAFMVQENTQNMLSTVLKDPKRAASLGSTLISVVNGNERLKECKPGTIVSAALRGEAMGLSLSLGQYAIVPYGDSANFQMQYKGICQLAIRSGQYSDFDVYDVREGEYKGRDPKTRNPVFEWIEDESKRETAPIVGYYGYYQLVSGFFKSVYWSWDKILKHADRYSKAFSLEKYRGILNGKVSAEEAQRLRRGTPWYDEPDSEAHMKMCKKTVLIQLLGDGKAPLSVEMESAIKADRDEDMYEQTLEFVDDTGTPAEQTDTAEVEIVEPTPEKATKSRAKKVEKVVTSVEPKTGEVKGFFEED